MTPQPETTSREIIVGYLARSEGESGFRVRVADGQPVEVELRVFEPPRLFEAFLVGRTYEELTDLTARVCGICPVAYQMSSVHAVESAFGVRVGGQLRRLRRLFYCGEWIESHTLSIYLLSAPDFLGYGSAFAMARQHEKELRRGLALRRLGNDIIALLGGREIHPVSARPGGFTRVPTKAELATLRERLAAAKEDALRALEWVAGLPLPELNTDREFVALSHADEYAMNEGRVVSSKGLDIPIDEFEAYFIEQQVPHSTALHCRLKERGPYFVGPLARVNLNFDRLTPDTQAAARACGVPFPNANPHASIVARAVEVLHAVDEARQIVEEYERPAPFVTLAPRAGIGYGLTEAPRGMLYHRYEFAADGIVKAARLIPPTSQNQGQIEEDLRAVARQVAGLPVAEATRRCEMVIRSYDPCISCSVH